MTTGKEKEQNISMRQTGHFMEEKCREPESLVGTSIRQQTSPFSPNG